MSIFVIALLTCNITHLTSAYYDMHVIKTLYVTRHRTGILLLTRTKKLMLYIFRFTRITSTWQATSVWTRTSASIVSTWAPTLSGNCWKLMMIGDWAFGQVTRYGHTKIIKHAVVALKDQMIFSAKNSCP